MAPRSTARVKIVSPNSGTVVLSRSTSCASARGHRSTAARTPLLPLGRNRSDDGSNLSTRSCPSASSSIVRGATDSAITPFVTTPGARGRGADREAIQRARDALESAGQHILRRPFSRSRGEGAAPADTAAPTTATTPSAAAREPPRRALALPPSILGLHQPGQRRDDSDASSRKRPRSVSSASRFSNSVSQSRSEASRTRAPAQRGPAPPPLPRGAPSTYTPASLSAAVARHVESAERPPLLPTGVCPPMFAGLSAIPLNESLFELTDGGRGANYYSGASGEAAIAAESDDGPCGGGSNGCPRRGVRPLWSLVGTFKVALNGVVHVDYGGDALHWQQRNPKGGFQRIRVPLPAVLDAVVARVLQEDEDIQEKQFTVIVRTSTRPSQVVFGFSSAREANEFRGMLRTGAHTGGGL